MRQHNQTIFSLESLQPDWLPSRRRKLARWSVGLVGGLPLGLLMGPAMGLLFGFTGGPFARLANELLIGLSFWLGGVLFFSRAIVGDAELEPTEILIWSWKDFRFWLLSGLIIGGIIGLILGGIIGLTIPKTTSQARSIGLADWLLGGLLAGLGLGLLIGLSQALLHGVSGKQLTERFMLSPNEGIRRSFKNGMLLFAYCLLAGLLAAGLLARPFAGLFIRPGEGLLLGLIFGLVGGLFWGLVTGLRFGLGASIQHYILRSWLAHNSTFPWQAIPFLEDATARILLRRVGGGYSFAHRLLLDYFADLNTQTPLAQEAVQIKSTPVQTKASTSTDES